MKYLFLLITITLTLPLNAQTFYVKYTQTMNVEALEDSINANESAKAFLSEEMKKDIFSQMAQPQDFELTYSQGKSLYQIAPEVEKEEDEENLEVGKGYTFNFSKMRRRFSPILFKDFNTAQYTKEQGIFDKKFLIKDQLQTKNWEITGQTKTFGDFTCTMATSTNEKNQKVSVCYTEDIPINEGPDDFYGLPGLVVQVIVGPLEINMSEIKILDEDTEIHPPTDGKVVTQKEYNDLMKEKVESMGGGKGMSIFH